MSLFWILFATCYNTNANAKAKVKAKATAPQPQPQPIFIFRLPHTAAPTTHHHTMAGSFTTLCWSTFKININYNLEIRKLVYHRQSRQGKLIKIYLSTRWLFIFLYFYIFIFLYFYIFYFWHLAFGTGIWHLAFAIGAFEPISSSQFRQFLVPHTRPTKRQQCFVGRGWHLPVKRKGWHMTHTHTHTSHSWSAWCGQKWMQIDCVRVGL